MFCGKCGSELKEGAKFCAKCGVAVEQPPVQEKADETQKKSGSIVKILAVVLGVVALVIVAVGAWYFTSDTYKYKKTMKLAEECLQEEDYEEALEYYEDLLKLDINIAEVYVKMADVYLVQNEIVEAFETILEGLEEVNIKADRDILLNARESMKEKIIVVSEYMHYKRGEEEDSATRTEYDTQGRKKKLTLYYDGIEYWVNKYDKEGMIYEQKQSISGRIVEFQNEYEYDKEGNLRKCSSYQENVLSEIYEYDASGNLTKYVCCYPNALPVWEEYQYDGEGNLLKEIHRDSDGAMIGWYEYEYNQLGNIDQIGRLLKSRKYDAEGGLEYREEYIYDEWGNQIQFKHVESDNTGNRKEYEYDELGNLVKVTTYIIWGGERVASWKECEYDEMGNEIEYITYNADGSIQGRGEQEYDIVGNCVESAYYNSEGEKSLVYEYEYDIYGNTTKEMEYRDGNLYDSTEYEYEYALKEED